MSIRLPPVRTFRASDGINIAFREWSTEGRTAILQHGFASDSLSEWRDPGIIEVLVSAGHRVVTIDARGHGESDTPYNPDLYGIPRLAQDLRELIDHHAEGRVDLVGYSMGAVAVIRTTLDNPGLVRRLVLSGIGASAAELGGVDTGVVDTHLLAEAFLTEDPATIDDPDLAGWRASINATGGDHRAIGAAAAALRPEQFDLGLISIPTLILTGADDPFASRPEVLAQHIPGALWHTLPGDHGSVRYESEFADELRDFLAG